MIKSDKQEYWGGRATGYSDFKWANDRAYLNEFLNACEFGRDDYVLDLGCGTGLVTKEIAMFVKRVIGLDNSKDMLAQCDGGFNLMLGDARDNPFPDAVFDRVIARNIFHHMTDGLLDGVRESYRVLKPGGKIIIGERVPPSDEVKDEYKAMLSLKDDRIVFTEDKLKSLLLAARFSHITSSEFWIKDISVRGWLDKSGLDDKTKAQIFFLHVTGSEKFKAAHRMRYAIERTSEKKGHTDVRIDIKNIVAAAEKS